jgi:HK97 family phage major capsid protein
MTLNELRKLWAEALSKREALAAKVAGEGRAYTAEEVSEDDALKVRAEDFEKTISRMEEIREAGERKGAASGTKAVDVSITRAEGEDEKGNCIVFKSFGEQLRSVYEVARDPHRRSEKLELCQKHMRAATGLNESQASDGGFLVQTDFSSDILKRAYDTAVFAPRCRKIGISTNANSIKIPAVDETSRANGSRMGGIQAYWEGEADAYTGSKPKFRLMDLVLKKLTGLCYASDEVLADANVLGSIISDGFKDEFAFKLDDAIFRGNGAGQPLGIMSSDSLVTISKVGSQTATTIVLGNVAGMRARMWSRSRGNAIWAYNQDCEPQLNVLSLSVGNNSYPVLMPATGIAGAPYDTMYGRPAIPTEYNETLGTKGDLAFLDLSQYLLIDKGSMQSAASVHVRFVYDEMTFKFTYRVDGQPIWNKPLTPYKGSATQSPFIVCETRS